MSKKVDLMNQYVADLAVLNIKFHNLHWNVVGERFVPVHVYLEEQYDALFEAFDEIAERLKMIGEYPLASLKAYLDVTQVKELPNGDYTIAQAFGVVKEEYEKLKALSIAVRALADEEGDFVTVALMEDLVANYDKQLWFISQSMKK
jgi:starvation-inducible DNA-binding protein